MIISVNKIYDFYELYNSSWGGAIKNLDMIKYFEYIGQIKLNDFCNYLNDIIKDSFNGLIDRTKLNDLIWFEDYIIEEFLNEYNINKLNNNYEEWFEIYNNNTNK